MKHRINLKPKQYSPAEKFLQSVLDRTTGVINVPQYPDATFYYDPDKKEINFGHNQKYRLFWVRNSGVLWSVLMSEYGLGFYSVQELIRDMVGTHYNIDLTGNNIHTATLNISINGLTTDD